MWNPGSRGQTCGTVDVHFTNVIISNKYENMFLQPIEPSASQSSSYCASPDHYTYKIHEQIKRAYVEAERRGVQKGEREGVVTVMHCNEASAVQDKVAPTKPRRLLQNASPCYRKVHCVRPPQQCPYQHQGR